MLQSKRVTLKKLAQYPLIAYEPQFTGWQAVTEAFKKEGLTPKVFVSAIDADVIKTCVEQGMGIGILAKMAFDPARDHGVRLINADHLFEPSTTRIALRRNAWLRGYVYDFIELFAPTLSRDVVNAALSGGNAAVAAP